MARAAMRLRGTDVIAKTQFRFRFPDPIFYDDRRSIRCRLADRPRPGGAESCPAVIRSITPRHHAPRRACQVRRRSAASARRDSARPPLRNLALAAGFRSRRHDPNNRWRDRFKIIDDYGHPTFSIGSPFCGAQDAQRSRLAQEMHACTCRCLDR
jgi:hypothetical protein